MLIKGLLLLLAVSSLSAGRLPPQPEKRIVGGFQIKIKCAPWQVSLRFKGVHTCGGSIYNEVIIITAAHCLFNTDKTPLKAEDFEVLAGSSNKLSNTNIVKVDAIKPHYEFVPGEYGNDIAIVKLSEPLDLTTKKMQKIALAEEDPAPETKALVTGWGEAINSYLINKELISIKYNPKYLYSTVVEIQKLEYCTSKLGAIKNNICAGSPGFATCNGDSGGPLVVDNQLVGVVSYGDCSSLTAYTSVSMFRKWIIKEAESI